MSSDTAMKSAGPVEASTLSSAANSAHSATSSVDLQSVSHSAPALASVTLDDKYTSNSGTIFYLAFQALVRLPMIQRQRDLAAGLNTAGFISGYRGSPLAASMKHCGKPKHLAQHHIQFVPGVNEDLAATAVWGTQTVDLIGPAIRWRLRLVVRQRPGVDRSADVFKHMNHAGTSKHGGVILVAGDDHGAYVDLATSV